MAQRLYGGFMMKKNAKLSRVRYNSKDQEVERKVHYSQTQRR
jgi:hypothetical protein